MTIIYLINPSTSKLFSEICDLDKPKTIATKALRHKGIPLIKIHFCVLVS